MKILFSHKLMGIVVSSSQTCNICWHGVTRLNAICVLISSLQHLWPPENRGVRWFSIFSFSFLASRLCLSLYLLFLSLCSLTLIFASPLPHLYGQISREDSLQYAEAVFLLCHDRDRPAVTQMGRLPVPLHISVQAPWDSGVQHASLLSF